MRARCLKISCPNTNKPPRSLPTRTRNTNNNKPSRSRAFSNSRLTRTRSRYRKPTTIKIKLDFNILDDDILCTVFEFIHFIHLAQISCVSKAFNTPYSQNLVWKNLCFATFSNKTYPQNGIIHWKKTYVDTLKQTKTKKVNTFFKKILRRSNINHTLPNTMKLLNALNIKYVVYINNILVHHDRQYNNRKKSKQIRSFDICNVLKIQNSDALSQFCLKDILQIKVRIKSTKLFESVVLLFDIDLCRMKIIKNINNNKNNMIKIYSHNNIHFAVYDKDHIAFIVLSLNHYQLLSNISSKLFHFDRLNYIRKGNENKRNFYGWKLQLMFRNLKKLYFNTKFYELIPMEGGTENRKDRRTHFKLIGNGNQDLEKIDLFPMYPWKSDTFTGKEVGVFEIDIVLLNDKQQILLAKTMMVQCVLIKDLYNFTDQCNDDERYLFTYKNQSDHEILNGLSGNIVVLHKFNCCCNLQNLNLYLNFTV